LIANQENDVDDPLGLTNLLQLDKFKRDSNDRKIHKIWNEELYPLYGGSILNPVKRINIIEVEDGETTTETIEIPNDLRSTLQRLYAN
jgi:hypothetical protein